MAICESLKVAHSLPPRRVVIASDSQILINASKSNSPPKDWRTRNLFLKARYRVSIRQVSWSWTSRLSNRAADHVDALPLRGNCPHDSGFKPSSFSS
ncbi:hypothetical protein ACLB2K_030170 [Fragaria x ananassa]